MPLSEPPDLQRREWLAFPTFMPRRYRPCGNGAWSGHLAFANDLIASTSPSLIVEVGAYLGESYFGFCQSVAENSLNCLCYGVGDWQHSSHQCSFTANDLFTEVSSYNEKNYAGFSYLIRHDTDESAGQFSNESIDVLHLDRTPNYEQVREDFRLWFPKVKRGGLVLLHDIVLRDSGFGVWRLWQEIEANFQETFSFHHSSGLGVVRKPGNGASDNRMLSFLFDQSVEAQDHVRRLYVLYAAHLESALRPQEEIVQFDSELKSAQAERALLGVQISQLTAERNYLRNELKRLETLLDARPRSEELASLREELQSVHQNYQDEKATRLAIQQSKSWRLTEPIRTLFNASKGKA